MSEHQPTKEKKKITLCLKNVSGVQVNETFNFENKVEKAVEAAIKAFHLDKHPPRPYEVHVEEGGRPGRMLRVDLSFGAQNVQDGDCLIIAPPATPDGSW